MEDRPARTRVNTLSGATCSGPILPEWERNAQHRGRDPIVDRCPCSGFGTVQSPQPISPESRDSVAEAPERTWRNSPFPAVFLGCAPAPLCNTYNVVSVPMATRAELRPSRWS